MSDVDELIEAETKKRRKKRRRKGRKKGRKKGAKQPCVCVAKGQLSLLKKGKTCRLRLKKGRLNVTCKRKAPLDGRRKKKWKFPKGAFGFLSS